MVIIVLWFALFYCTEQVAELGLGIEMDSVRLVALGRWEVRKRARIIVDVEEIWSGGYAGNPVCHHSNISKRRFPRHSIESSQWG